MRRSNKNEEKREEESYLARAINTRITISTTERFPSRVSFPSSPPTLSFSSPRRCCIYILSRDTSSFLSSPSPRMFCLFALFFFLSSSRHGIHLALFLFHRLPPFLFGARQGILAVYVSVQEAPSWRACINIRLIMLVARRLRIPWLDYRCAQISFPMRMQL